MNDPTPPPVPSLYQWAGGGPALDRLMERFYQRVPADPILAPVFAGMSPDHARHVAHFVAEVFGGPARYSQERGGHPNMVESDTSNPDVFKAYREQVPNKLVNLDDADGWIQLVNLCDAQNDSVVVVNTGARNNRGVSAYGETLNSTLAELRRQLTTLWVINRQRDSLELLREFMQAIPESEVHVVRNGYFGEEKKFELYNESRLRTAVEGQGGKSVTFPELADRVSDDLYTKRSAIAVAAKTLPIGNRAELARWRREAGKVLSEVIT